MKSTIKIKKYVSGLITLLEDNTLDKIRVKDICEICGTDRQNFYYYFNDKYELASWIFRLDHMESLQKFNDRYCVEQFACLLEKFWEKRKIYVALLSDDSQNSLMAYLTDERDNVYNKLFKEVGEIDITGGDYEQTIAFTFNGAVQSIKSWLNGEFDMSPEKHAKLLYDMLPFSINNVKTDTMKKQQNIDPNFRYKDLHEHI